MVRSLLEFVGGDGHFYAGFVQIGQQLLHPRVGARVDVDVGGIVFLEVIQRSVHGGVVCLVLGGQRLQDEVAHAVPHHAAVVRHFVQRPPAQGQRVVDGRAEVFERVDECAVEVPEDEFSHTAAKLRNKAYL